MRPRWKNLEPDPAAIRPEVLTDGGVPDRCAQRTSACFRVPMGPEKIGRTAFRAAVGLTEVRYEREARGGLPRAIRFLVWF
jgi:hypothetical protein